MVFSKVLISVVTLASLNALSFVDCSKQQQEQQILISHTTIEEPSSLRGSTSTSNPNSIISRMESVASDAESIITNLESVAESIGSRSSTNKNENVFETVLVAAAAGNLCGECCDDKVANITKSCGCKAGYSGDGRCCLLDSWNDEAKLNPSDFQYAEIENKASDDMQIVVTLGNDGGFVNPPSCIIVKKLAAKTGVAKQYFKKGMSGNMFPYSLKDGPWKGQNDHVISEFAFFDVGTNFDISIIPDSAPGSCLDQKTYANTCSSDECMGGGNGNTCACSNGFDPHLQAAKDKCTGPGQAPQGTNDCHNTNPITPYWAASPAISAKEAGMAGIIQSGNTCDSTCAQAANNCQGQGIIGGWKDSYGSDYASIAAHGGYRSGLFGEDACYTFQDCSKKALLFDPNHKSPLNYNAVIFNISQDAMCFNAKQWKITGLKCLATSDADPNINELDCMVAPHEDWKNVGCQTSVPFSVRYCDVGDLVCAA